MNLSSRRVLRIHWLAFAVGGLLVANADAPPTNPPASIDDLYNTGKQLFDDYAPPEIKEQYDFPTKEQWDAFAVRFQQALDNNSLEGLAEHEPEARSALNALHALPGYEGYAEWLGLRIDEVEGAAQASRAPARLSPKEPSVRPGQSIPYLDLWKARVKDRPIPSGAGTLMPKLREAFIAAGVPPELAWIAEAESTLDPDAVSPAGAKGLFQLTSATAKANGLSVFLPDERTNPEASARAAAHLLRELKDKFGDWPLALAAYNAGEGRVGRLLASRSATTFAEIASSLPAETRMYVPKVLALIELRTGITLERLATAAPEIGDRWRNSNLSDVRVL